jgi:hypothetical protein
MPFLLAEKHGREVAISYTISRDVAERCNRCSNHLEWPLLAS